jgi:hypothetical protein
MPGSEMLLGILCFGMARLNEMQRVKKCNGLPISVGIGQEIWVLKAKVRCDALLV